MKSNIDWSGSSVTYGPTQVEFRLEAALRGGKVHVCRILLPRHAVEADPYVYTTTLNRMMKRIDLSMRPARRSK